MISPEIPHISVIVASCRPTLLANCLYQIQSQSLGNLKVEVVIVVEGDKSQFQSTLDHFKITQVVYKKVEGRWGAFAKDEGLKIAKGNYVCFWDDDNIYYPHALATLYATTQDHDIGIVKTSHMGIGYIDIPRYKEISYGDIDSMCFCIRRKIAIQAQWADHADNGTDYQYLKKLLKITNDIRFVDIRIGEKNNAAFKK